MREIDSELYLATTAEDVVALIERGADVNATDGTGKSILAEHIDSDHVDAAVASIKKGADIDRLYSGKPLIFWAHTPEMVKALAEAGVNINAKDENNHTVLSYQIDNIEIVKALIEAGVDVNAKDSCGRTALYKAKNAETIEVLARAGADINAKDDTGMTALVNAVLENNLKTVKALLDVGIDISIKDNKGRTVLDYVNNPLFCRDPEIKALVEAQAKEFISEKGNIFSTPVEREKSEQNCEINSELKNDANSNGDTETYLRMKNRRDILRRIVAEKINKRDAKNPNPANKTYKPVIKNKTLTKLIIAWKDRQEERK